jgi:hypothetical protein
MSKPIEEMTWAEKAEEALRRAVAKAIEEHRRMGVPIVIWKEGRVQIIPAEEIPPLALGKN